MDSLGDHGCDDENGEIFVIDRVKDVIQCSTYYVCPTVMENVILSYPEVKEVAVVAHPSPDDDELLMAFVIRKKNSSDSRIWSHSRPVIENNVLKGKTTLVRRDETSLGKFILDGLEKNSDSVGQIDCVTGEKYTCTKMRDRSVRCALWMRSQGLLPRDVVATYVENHLDFAMPIFAALYLGAVVSPWDLLEDESLRYEDLRHLMKICKPKMVFVSEDSASIVAEVAKTVELDLKIIVLGRVPGFLEFDSVIAEPRIDEVKKFECFPIESWTETAMIMISSGTTGFPKGVALNHGSFLYQMRQAEPLGMHESICFNFGSTAWADAIDSTLMSVALNVPRMLTPVFEETSACALIEKYKANWLFLTPSMIHRLLKSDAVARYDLSSVTKVVYSAASLSLGAYRALEKLMPNARIFSAYGLSELGGYLSIQSTESKIGSCGQIVENAQLKVVDVDTGRILAANQRGELIMKTPSMMNFYYGNPEATAEAVDDEGWMHSSDLGCYDEDGEIFVLDRIKDVIRVGHHDVPPSEIESVILSHPGVKEVAVVGQARDQDDDRLIAFVVRAEDSSDNSEQVTEADIVNLVAAELPESRQLRGGVKFIDQLPKTPSNKIRRIVLRDLAKSMVKFCDDRM